MNINERILNRQVGDVLKKIKAESSPGVKVELVTYGKGIYEPLDDEPIDTPDVMQQTNDLLAGQIARSLDDIVREAINRQLGRSDWVINDLAGRLNRCIYPDKREVYSVDGVPVLEVFPMDMMMESNIMTSCFNYRYLVPEAGDDRARD